MTSDSRWYVAAPGGSPTGPFTAQQITERLLGGQLDPTMLCWRDGMAEWLPLTHVQSFASGIGSAPPMPPPIVNPQYNQSPQYQPPVQQTVVIHAPPQSQALPALVNAFCIPGLGQLIQGRLLAAICWWLLHFLAALSLFV